MNSLAVDKLLHSNTSVFPLVNVLNKNKWKETDDPDCSLTAREIAAVKKVTAIESLHGHGSDRKCVDYYERLDAMATNAMWDFTKTKDNVDNIGQELDLERYSDRRRVEHKIANKLIEAAEHCEDPEDTEAFEKKAEKMKSCRLHGHVGKTSKGFQIMWNNKCSQSLLCPDESRAEQRRLANKYTEAISTWAVPHTGRSVHYSVMTIKNVPPGQLHEYKRSLLKKINKHIKKFPNIKGTLSVQEDPLSASGEWNLHVNLIILVSGFFSYKEFRKEWGSNLFIRKLDQKGIKPAVRELVKYSVKFVTTKKDKEGASPPLVDWPIELFIEWLKANRLFRRTRTYGTLYAIHRKKWNQIKNQENNRKHWINIGQELEWSMTVKNLNKEWNKLSDRDKIVIGRVMDGAKPEKEEVEWIGSVSFEAGKYSINLIQGDKFFKKMTEIENISDSDPPWRVPNKQRGKKHAKQNKNSI